jgi:phospholipid/cholesterol/gamma-HCH transport system ATP-binding protein
MIMNQSDSQCPIQVRDLHKSFGARTVLNGVSLSVAAGQTLAVMGRSGTGKSVLLKLLIGLLTPDSGSVTVRGTGINAGNRDQLNETRKKIGFLFQQAALYDSLTLEENVIFPMSRHTSVPRNEQEQHARQLLSDFGMEKDIEKVPSEISGGMQKRVGLARALALDPEILLFDEPTAGLDPITSAEIAKLIIELKEKRRITSVVVTHDVPTVRSIADHVVLLNEGKIQAEGRFSDLKKSKDPMVNQFLQECA